MNLSFYRIYFNSDSIEYVFCCRNWNKYLNWKLISVACFYGKMNIHNCCLPTVKSYSLNCSNLDARLCCWVSLFQSRCCVIEINRAQTQNRCVVFLLLFALYFFFSQLCFLSRLNHKVCHFSWVFRINMHSKKAMQNF